MRSTVIELTVLGAMMVAAVAPVPASARTTGCTQSGAGRVVSELGKIFGRKIGSVQLGSTLSDVIACALSEAERRKAQRSQDEALNSGRTGTPSRRTWSSDEHQGVGGGTEVVSRSTDAGLQCATQRTFITDVDGQQKSIERRMCQGTDGRWAVA